MSVFIGRGIVRVVPVNAVTGDILGTWLDLGEVSNFEPGASVDTLEKFSKRDAASALIAFVDRGITSSLSLTLDEPSTQNLSLILRGDPVEVASGTVTDEPLQSDDADAVDLVDDDLVRTKYPINAITNIKDSAGTPATVTGSKYERVEGSSFYIRMLDVAGYTQPFTITYTRLAHSIIPAFEQNAKNYRVAIENVNLVDNEAQLVEYYNVRFPPAENFGLITDDFAPFVLNGRTLAVVGFAADSHLGKYGRVVRGY